MVSVNRPPAKFDSEPCKAKPMAKPAAPIIGINADVCTPSYGVTIMNSNVLSAQSRRFLGNLLNELSIFCFSKMVPTTFLMILITQISIKKN